MCLNRMSAHTFFKTQSSKGKLYERGTWLAVLDEVIQVQCSTFSLQDVSCQLLSATSELLMCFVLCCKEEVQGWFVSHMRKQRLKHHKPPLAHTAVYHSVLHHLISAQGLTVKNFSLIGSSPGAPLFIFHPFFF